MTDAGIFYVHYMISVQSLHSPAGATSVGSSSVVPPKSAAPSKIKAACWPIIPVRPPQAFDATASVGASRKKRQKSANKSTIRFASAPSPSPSLPGMRLNSKNKPILTKNLRADLRPRELLSVSGSPPSKPGATFVSAAAAAFLRPWRCDAGTRRRARVFWCRRGRAASRARPGIDEKLMKPSHSFTDHCSVENGAPTLTPDVWR